MQVIKFGTDGFRGIIADNFTFKNVKRIAYSIALYLLKKNKSSLSRGVVIGFDRRFLSDRFARSIAHILSGHGINVLISGCPVPTPAISCYIREKKLLCGVIVTASHNPPSFNGIKVKNEFGASTTETETKQIEKLISYRVKTSLMRTKLVKIREVDVLKPYLKFVKQYLNLKILKQSRFKVVIDAMHGVGAGIIEKILGNTDCKVDSLRVEHDILFGGVSPEPISENLDILSSKLKDAKYDLALALDGDADRIGAMCPNGRYISSHMAICLLLLHLIENRKMSGKIVKSINTTTMVDKIAQYYKLPLDVVSVGFKNIAAKMLKEDILLGGEESGGIGFKNYMPERDGILSGLLMLELMAYRKQSILDIIGDMEKRFGHFVYLRRDLKTKAPKKIVHPRRIQGKKVVKVETYDGTKFILEDESWLLIRASGTEPIVRIYAESQTLKQTRGLINFGCSLL